MKIGIYMTQCQKRKTSFCVDLFLQINIVRMVFFKYNARLVAKVYNKKPAIDILEAFAPVALS